MPRQSLSVILRGWPPLSHHTSDKILDPGAWPLNPEEAGQRWPACPGVGRIGSSRPAVCHCYRNSYPTHTLFPFGTVPCTEIPQACTPTTAPIFALRFNKCKRETIRFSDEKIRREAERDPKQRMTPGELQLAVNLNESSKSQV